METLHQPLPEDWPKEWQPEKGDRICSTCLPRPVKLVLNFIRPGFEFRCPRCGLFDEWFGTTYKPQPRKGKVTMQNQTFGAALEAAKQGKRISREGWNGRYMFVFQGMPRVEINSDKGGFTTSVDAAEELKSPYAGPCLCLKTAQDTIQVGWLASQDDMLANDWTILD